jgi:16S rRNA C967 or C1407 C5-methylase (RsmB/RsmF family)/NOL1/NOP2/fmu family ribosome biogenesis protein
VIHKFLRNGLGRYKETVYNLNMLNLPEQLLNSLSQLAGFDKDAFIEAHKEENKITSIRLNPFKKTDLDFVANEKIPWCDEGYYLQSRPSFTYDPLFHAGCYYVQEPGSMFVEFCLKQTVDINSDLNVLDGCAAPGGKTTLINSLLSKNSLLVSNELIKSRADILAQNLSKWGTCNTIVTNGETKRFSALTSFFDAVVIDAPCSGSGLFRKQPEAIEEWSESAVKACSMRQRDILNDILPALKQNGILIYCTCSYSIEENEQIVKWLSESHGMEFISFDIPANWGIIDTGFGYRFYPHLVKSEGFFCAVLRKTDSEQAFHIKQKQISRPSKQEQNVLAPFVNDFEEKIVLKRKDQFHLLNSRTVQFLSVFEKQFYFKKAGVLIGEIKGKDLVTDHELALSTDLKKTIPLVEIDKENSLKFLKKENFSVAENRQGLVLITYKGFGLGWAKILPNRINNYLPNELRILK